MESTETLWTVFCRLLTESSWSPHRVHETRFEDSMRTVAICVDSMRSPHGLLMESTQSPHGPNVDCRKYSHGVLRVLIESSWSP
jgi:hypothetical protein